MKLKLTPGRTETDLPGVFTQDPHKHTSEMKKVAEIALILVLTIIIAWAIIGFILWNWNMATWHPMIRVGMITLFIFLITPASAVKWPKL